MGWCGRTPAIETAKPIKDEKHEIGILQTFFPSSATLQGKIFAELLKSQSKIYNQQVSHGPSNHPFS
jgi:hypothetical protein